MKTYNETIRKHTVIDTIDVTDEIIREQYKIDFITFYESTSHNIEVTCKFTDGHFETWTPDQKHIPKGIIIEAFLRTEIVNDLRADVIGLNYLLTLMASALYKTTDSGAYGKVYEIIAKLYLKGKRGRLITSPMGEVDLIYQGKKVEVKTACGQLTNIEKADLVVYSPDNKEFDPCNAYAMGARDFLNLLDSVGLIRESKKDRNGNRVKAIQSFRNSAKKNYTFMEKLNEHICIEELKRGIHW